MEGCGSVSWEARSPDRSTGTRVAKAHRHMRRPLKMQDSDNNNNAKLAACHSGESMLVGSIAIRLEPACGASFTKIPDEPRAFPPRARSTQVRYIWHRVCRRRTEIENAAVDVMIGWDQFSGVPAGLIAVVIAEGAVMT